MKKCYVIEYYGYTGGRKKEFIYATDLYNASRQVDWKAVRRLIYMKEYKQCEKQ